MNYRREIDGLRAIAVLPVIFFHAGFPVFSGGFAGVDVFFVISGYLIASIILNDLEQKRFSLLNFYERRARRILPALFFVMLVAIPFAWFLLTPYDMKDFSQSLVAVSVFASNIEFWLESGYFGRSNGLKPLLHTWSLAVEEQYYLLFPLFMLATWRFGKKFQKFLLAGLALASFALAVWACNHSPVAAFFILPTRAWELLSGVFAAYFFASERSQPEFVLSKKALSEALGGTGLLLIAFAVFAFDENVPFPGAYALVPTMGTLLIILFTSPQTFTGRILGTRWLVGLGLISYSAYLWHQPIFAFAREHNVDSPGGGIYLLLSTIAIVMAYLSWRYIEKPFRDKERVKRSAIVLLGLLFASGFIAFGLAGYFTDGFLERMTKAQQEVLSYTDYPKDDLYRTGSCFLEDNHSYSDFSQQCMPVKGSSVTFVWGDSHAAALSAGFRAIGSDVAQLTASSCPPVVSGKLVPRGKRCRDINEFILGKIKEASPKNIYLDANWYMNRDRVSSGDIVNTIREVKDISPSSKVFVVGVTPLWPPGLPTNILRSNISLDREHYLPLNSYKKIKAMDDNMKKAVVSADASYISVLDIMCDDDQCLAVVKSGDVFMPTAWDYGHLTAGGSRWLVEKIIQGEKAYRGRKGQ